MIHVPVHSLWFQGVTVAAASVALWLLLAYPLLRRKLNRQHTERLVQAARQHRATTVQYRRILVALGVDPDHDDSCPACGGTGSRWDIGSGRDNGSVSSGRDRAGRGAGNGPAPGGQPGAGDGDDTQVLPGRPYLTRSYGHVTSASDVDATRGYGGIWSSIPGGHQGEPPAPGSVRHSEWPTDDFGRTLGAFPWGDSAKRPG